MSPPEKIDVIVLAGGLGIRLREVVRDTPKPLAPVGGKPFLDILLDGLDGKPWVGKVILAIGYQADAFIERYRGGKGHAFPILFSVEREPLGTGGAVRLALPMTGTPEILVLNGDSFVEVDWDAFLASHRGSGLPMTMVLRGVEDASRYGRVILGTDGRVHSFEEKRSDATPGLVNAGVYLFDRRLVHDMPEGQAISLERDLMPGFLRKGVGGFVTRGKFIDIGIPESYRMAQDCIGGEKE